MTKAIMSMKIRPCGVIINLIENVYIISVEDDFLKITASDRSNATVLL